MIVLLEGPDCSGKSTIANKLIDAHQFFYMHTTKYADINAVYRERARQLCTMKYNNINVVIDRLFWSNIIYSEVFHDSSVLDHQIMDQLNDMIDCVVFCVPQDKQKYINKFNAVKCTRFEDYSEMSEVYNRFNKLVHDEAVLQYHSRQKVYNYDMFSCDIKEVDNFVASLLK